MKKKSRKPGGGRKELPDQDKKTVIRLWFTGTQIEKLGGEESVQKSCYDLLSKKLKDTSA